jgi:hypothetical protein
VVRGERIGQAVITVEGPTGAERTAVEVQEPPPDQSTPVVTAFSISPRTGGALAPGATRQFTTQTIWSDGLPRSVAVTYSATGGTVSPTGLFTAGSVAGTFLVVATCACARADSAVVTVEAAAAQLASLRISPRMVSVAAGDTIQFSAQATWSTGATTLPPLTWVAEAGSVNGIGRFIAPGESGVYRVIVSHTAGSLRDTATVTVVGSGPPPAGASFCPNEPPGYVKYDDVGFSSTTAPAGFSFDSRREIVSDPEAPYYPTSLAFRFLAGQRSGGTGSFGTQNFASPRPRSVFVCVVFRQSANFRQHVNATKFFYPYSTNSMGQGQRTWEFSFRKVGLDLANGLYQWKSIMYSGDTDGYSDNVEPINMTTGTWYRLEMVATQNTPGQKNGVMRWWTSTWTGTAWESPRLRGNHQNVLYSPTGWPGTWHGWTLTLYFGGQGGDPLTEDQFVYLNRLYLSTAR